MRIVDRGTIFDASSAPPEQRFCIFTDLELLSDGTLLVAFRTGSSKDTADEDIRIMRSDDQGHTWKLVFDGFGDVPPGSGGRIRGGGLTEVSPGRLMGAFVPFDRSDPTLPLANPKTQGTLSSRIFVGESEDAGQSWGPLREVSPQLRTGALTGSILVLRDSTLALQYETWKGYYDTSPGEHHASLHLSSDGGKSWTGPVIVAHDPQGHLLYWDQRLSVDPDDGHLIAVFWTHDRQAQEDVPMHVAWGSPDGKEWTEPVSTGIAGQICAPLCLPGNKVFAAYVHRHHPPSLRAILSDDGGHSWTAAPELVFYDKMRGGRESGMGGKRDFGDYWADMNVWTFGHPAAILLPGGDVLVAHYAGDEEAMGLHWVQIALSST